MTGRQLARLSALQYGETLWSEVYPGSRPSVLCLRPAVHAFENAFDLQPPPDRAGNAFDLGAARRQRVLWRLDGGFGTDGELRWLLARNYQVLAKGFAGRRAVNLAQQVTRWNPHGDAWLGHVAAPWDWGRELCVWVKRRREKAHFKYSYYLTTLKLHSLQAAMTLYDQRGAAEIEQFRTDKQGLHLAARRKHRWLAQKALIVLTDIAHNLLANFHHQALTDSPFAGYAAKRIVRHLLTMEGRVTWLAPHRIQVDLCQQHPLAHALVACLRRYCQAGENPG